VELAPPGARYDGRHVVVTLTEVEGATDYRVYVWAHESGAGARVMGKSKTSTFQVRGLRPDYPLYFFAAVVKGREGESKPSPIQRHVLKDEFSMK
jgi:hypothetical protein